MPNHTPLTEADFAGFLIAHAGMRHEFGRLATAARTATDPSRVALIEDQIVLVTETLHHHHAGEDDELWPRLRARVPAAVPELDALESEHDVIDPLIAAATDTSVPMAARAEVLQELHEHLNAHLDREERVALPLFAAHITRPEWEALAARMERETDRRRTPLLFGWLASCGTPEQCTAALAGAPVIGRVLFRLFWWPSYQRRFRALYNVEAPELVM